MDVRRAHEANRCDSSADPCEGRRERGSDCTVQERTVRDSREREECRKGGGQAASKQRMGEREGRRLGYRRADGATTERARERACEKRKGYDTATWRGEGWWVGQWCRRTTRATAACWSSARDGRRYGTHRCCEPRQWCAAVRGVTADTYTLLRVRIGETDDADAFVPTAMAVWQPGGDWWNESPGTNGGQT